MQIIRRQLPLDTIFWSDLTLPIGVYGRVIKILRGTPELMGASAHIFPYMLQVGDVVIQTLHGKYTVEGRDYLSTVLYNITRNFSGFLPSYWRLDRPTAKPICILQEIKRNG